MRLPAACALLLFGPAQAAGAVPTIPLCPGLTLVTAVEQPNGDYESIKTIESVDAKQVRLRYSVEQPNTGMFADAAEPVLRATMFRTVLSEDLRSAKLYQQVFIDGSAELVPGTTAIGTSAAVLRALVTTGSSDFAYSLAPGVVPLTADPENRPNFYDYMTNGRLERVGRSRLTVLVNDRPTELPVVHARGEFAGEQSEFFFLDDPANPLALRFRTGIGSIPPMDPAMAEMCKLLDEARGRGEVDTATAAMMRSQCLPEGGDASSLQVIKISYGCGDAGPQPGAGPGAPSGAGGTAAPTSSLGVALERSLAETGRAEVYSIYFGFDSDRIREASKPTLGEIAAVLRRHPDWRLAVEGHTDSVASEEYNLDLSRRRAAAVKKALVERYGVVPGRLTTAGYGESRPKDTNDTLEGRARNRRVELVRQD